MTKQRRKRPGRASREKILFATRKRRNAYRLAHRGGALNAPRTRRCVRPRYFGGESESHVASSEHDLLPTTSFELQLFISLCNALGSHTTAVTQFQPSKLKKNNKQKLKS